MATLIADQAAATYPAYRPIGQNDCALAVGTYSLLAALELNDVIQLVKLPPGAEIHDVALMVTDLDTNGTPLITLDVGNGDDPNYFVNASTIGQTGGIVRTNTVTAASSLALTAEDTIDVTVSAAPATGATSGTVKLMVFYTVD